MSLQRRINRSHSAHIQKGIGAAEPVTVTPPMIRTATEADPRNRMGAWEGPNHQDKGKENGRCNRTACQLPLKDEPVNQFMDGNFTGGPRLYYCRHCAYEFDKWDYRSGDPVRIKREPKMCVETPPDSRANGQ